VIPLKITRGSFFLAQMKYREMKYRDGKLIRQTLLGAAFLLAVAGYVGGRGNVTNAQQAQKGSTSAEQNFLTGTYREKNSSDAEIGRKVLAATAHLDEEERVRQGRALLRTLRSAPSFAIEQYGTTFMLNYPGGVRIPYEADGKARVMRATGGESVTVRAARETGRLLIDLTWSGGERLRLVFERAHGNGELVITRTAGSRFIERPISITSEYERTSPKATRTFDRAAGVQ
jgi:hypothetical protein